MAPPFFKNAPGDFYTKWLCLGCEAPYSEAPDLIGTDDDEGGYHCYFKKQPKTPEETERAIMACAVGCIGCVRYAGSDPTILKRLEEHRGGWEASDVLRAQRKKGGD